MASENLGRVTIVNKGAWDNLTAYTRLDAVTNDGGTYIAVQDVPAGTLLSDTDYWHVLIRKGDKGDPGLKGPTGNIIESCEKKSTSLNVDTYTMTMANGDEFDFDVKNGMEYKRYGVSGIGLQSAALTRIYDSVGMIAQVGTDDGTATVVNDFDDAPPFKHKKCVGNWTLGTDGYPKFNVQAYFGDEGYTEDGTKGDYVAVELPLSYYYLKDNVLIISEYKYPEYKAFDIFCRDHDQSNLLEKVYVPAYALALDADGYAVSLPGLDNEQGDYKTLFEKARNYNNTDLDGFGMLMPAAMNFYYWAMFTVEFATQNCQDIMYGCANLRHNNSDTCTFIDATHVLLNNWNAGRVIGEYVAIIASDVDYNHKDYQASHRIVSVTRCDNTGTASNSGTYSLVEIEDLGKEYYEYDTTGETTYRFVARPWRTGACNSVVTPSGSPVSNSNGYYPMRYRYRENIYGNQFKTSIDLFSVREGTGDSDYYLDWYYLPDPNDVATPANPNAPALAASPYVKLGVQTAHADYVNGYIKSKKYDAVYPDIWIPFETSGAGVSTFFCDYAPLVNSSVVRSVRFGGYWYNGGNAGLSHAAAYNAPSSGYAPFGGDLCFAQ